MFFPIFPLGSYRIMDLGNFVQIRRRMHKLNTTQVLGTYGFALTLVVAIFTYAYWYFHTH
jgi:hypothetical protein